MALQAFTPPGGVTDLSDRGRQAWSRDVAKSLTDNARGNPNVPNDSPRDQFFNQLGVELAADATIKAMRWGAFPRKLARQPAPRRWTLAESRDAQEEYCEWVAVRDSQNRIVKAIFTSEVPSYFHLLAADDPQRLLDVYRKHVSPDVRLNELMSGSSYQERNRWNRSGAMHMVQGANTLGAAVLLVAQASIVRAGSGGPMTNANDLIRCGVNADPDRNSDPLIVGDVNTLARQGARITFDDPAGLYLDGLQTAGWETPNANDDPNEFWVITRGDENHALRAVYEVPADRGYTVSDIRINGRPITSASQIAEGVSVKVVGLAEQFGRPTNPRGCADEGRAAADESELPSADELMAAVRSHR